jgi:hypothetical protein
MIQIEIDRDRVAAFCRRHRIRRLALFGSAVRPGFGADSDVDVLVEFDAGARVGFLALARAARELSALLGRRADLVLRTGLKPLIRKEVLSQEEVIFAA